ncbi:MAG: hypothetical protein JSS75_09360 [Bacteroidetes bacterium]|nr:hypothetical protein [Bacteroidota bacterium]
MRYAAILILAVMLASCGITRDYSSVNHVTLQFTDSSLKDCYLLSVGDDALIVSDIDPAGMPAEALSLHEMILPTRAVDRVYRRNHQSFAGTFLPTIADIFSTRRAFRVNAFGNNVSALYDAVRYSFEYFTSKSFSEYELTNDRDVQMLQTDVAQFPQTPAAETSH